MQHSPAGLGLNSWTQQTQQHGQSATNHTSIYNNGFTRMSFKVTSSLPTNYSTTNTQSREFSNYAFIPVVNYLGAKGVINVPESLKWSSPDGIPTWSEMCNWYGQPGNPTGPIQVPPQVPYPAPMVMPPMNYAPPPPMSVYQPPMPGPVYQGPMPEPGYPLPMPPSGPEYPPTGNASNASDTPAPQPANLGMVALLLALLGRNGKSKKTESPNPNSTQNGQTINLGNTDDTVDVTGNNNTVNANGGNDSINNSGNQNTINGGAGNDTIHNSGDENLINGGEGHDTINNEGGDRNTLRGSAGNDTINNNAGNDNLIEGGDGNDTLTSTEGSRNTLHGGSGDDTITVDGGSKNLINGNDGEDTLTLNDNAESSVYGGAGNDTINVNGGEKNVVQGQGGNDTINVNASNHTTVVGSAGDDTINVNGGDGHVINGGDGKDTITLKNTTNSRVLGGNDDDTIEVDANSDNVRITGGAGNDTVRLGGSVSDYELNIRTDGTKVYTHRTNENVFNIADDVENIIFTNGNTGGQTVHNTADGRTIITGAGNDTVVNSGDNNTINTAAGDDTITNTGDNNTLSGGDGADTVNQNGGKGNTINGGAGGDTINISDSENTVVNAGEGDDLIQLNGTENKNTFINGGAGNDTVRLNGGRSQYTISLDAQGRRVYTCNDSGNKTTLANDIENVVFSVHEDAITGVNANRGGSVTGDPHFRDMGNTNNTTSAINFDVMGQDGDIYNLLSDQNIQMNGKFKTWTTEGITVVYDLGLKIMAAEGEKRIEANADGTIKVNGSTLADGQQIPMTFFDHNGNPVAGFVKKEGKKLLIETNEYSIKADLNGNHINTFATVKAGGNMTDYVASHGLLGQSADGDGLIKVGKKGIGAQGENAIEGAYTDYKVSGLFENDDQYSRYGDNITYVKDTTDIDGDGNKTEAKAIKIGNVFTSILDTVAGIWRSVRQDAQSRYIVDTDTNNDGIVDGTRVLDMSLYS